MSRAALRADPAIVSQAVFRAVMDAMARPGQVRSFTTSVRPPLPLRPTTAAIARTLLDYETPFWLDGPLAACAEAAAWLRFETGASLAADACHASFALIADAAALPPFERFSLGEYPDRATTLVIQVERFGGGETIRLSGPGIDGHRDFSAAPLPKDFAARLTANRALFPCGVDLLLVSDDAIAALPRSVHVEPGIL
jgi:alpha-D-ribose 1-methylphosphonate 5-triphosphate synthase subunit PhnH